MTSQLSARPLSVAAIQLNSQDDKRANIEAAISAIGEAASTGARLIVLPEIWTYLGPPEEIGAHAEEIPGPVTASLAEEARRHSVYLHAGSIHESVPGEPKSRNTSVVFDPAGEIVAKYSKIHMFDVDLENDSIRESATASAGDEIVTLDIDGFRLGLAICYDLRFPELFRILALRGCDVITLPAAFTMTTGKDHWELLIRARAIENQVYMIAPNQFGPHKPGRLSYGRSMIVDPWGLVLATAPDQECVITATLDNSWLETVRNRIPALANRQPGAYDWPTEAVTVG